MAKNLPKNLQMTGVSRPSVQNDGFPVDDRLFTSPEALAANPVVGPYHNVTEYLDIHYDLLSEDLFNTLRKTLKESKSNPAADCVVKGVRFRLTSNGYSRGRHRYVNCLLSIKSNENKTLEPSFGSLLVFSEGDFDKNIFLGKVISDKDANGKAMIEVELKLPLGYMDELNAHSFSMIKGDAFYYMYYHVLKVLNLLSEQSFPMKKYIVYGTKDTEVTYPSYLTDVSVLKICEQWGPVLGPSKWLWGTECSELDESQFHALKTAVTQELAVIYGAPGTGKTYFGVRLVKVFLDNMNAWNMGGNTPLLVVCQSNQALDHFMENLLMYTNQIVRVGDQCQSKSVLPYSLRELVCRHVVRKSRKSETMNSLRSHLDRIDSLRQEIQEYHMGVEKTNITTFREKLEILESLEYELHNNLWDKIPYKYDNSLHVLKKAFVIGLTSTAAAARRNFLEELKSPIVIIEEAGEMLEAHNVVSMTEHCQHLILLGDTKQLKPMVNTYHLGRDYNLNTSLFERLLKNGITDGCSLHTQHRMQPEIANLLRPHIYEVLYDSPDIEIRNIRGLSKNVMFLDHREPEQKIDRDFWNRHEVSTLINLAYYLVVYQKYSPADITIISMYSEQRKRFIQARDSVPSLVELEVATVDGYQGRENQVILLSLVRSNTQHYIGFLEDESRICVALSRARTGLFMMGNMDCLRASNVWNEVRICLENQQQIKPYFTLYCEEHQQTSRELSKLDERNFKFCSSCNENTWINDTDSVYINIPRLQFRRDASYCEPKIPDFRGDFDRRHWGERNRGHGDCFSGDWGARICGLLLGISTLCISGTLFWSMFGSK